MAISETRVVPGALSLYQDLLGRNQSNYNTMLSAYGGGQQNQNATLPGIYQSYSDLGKNVGDIYDRSYERTAKDIGVHNDVNFGKAQQALIGRGLGGFTGLVNAGRAVGQDTANQLERAGLAFGRDKAEATRGVGLAGLAARMQGLGMQTGLQQNFGNSLAGYHFANTLGQLLGGYSNQGGYGGYGGGVSGSAMGGGGMGGVGGVGGVGGLEGMLSGMGGGHANYGGGGGMGSAGPGAAFGGLGGYGMLGGAGMNGQPGFGGSQTAYPGGDNYLNQLGYGLDQEYGQQDMDQGSGGFDWSEY